MRLYCKRQTKQEAEIAELQNGVRDYVQRLQLEFAKSEQLELIVSRVLQYLLFTVFLFHCV